MNPHLQKVAARIDALSLRERVLLFSAVAALYVCLMYAFGLAPMFIKQDALRKQIIAQQNHIESIDNEIRARVQAAAVDPDAPTRARIDALRADTETLATSLRALQNGLVAPEQMAPLVESILRANGKLALSSLHTLPSEPVGTPAAPGLSVMPVAATAAATPERAPPAVLLYRHGVEVTVRGSYLDMLAYMTALEAMPTRLFWGRAELNAETYPTSTLTLTLYTLSLDPKWMKL